MDEQPRLIAEERAEYTTARPDAERAAYIERLRAKLADPEFRKIEGFPIGDDEAILALSDPPYYTACPNPFLPEIIEGWRAERRTLRAELGLPDDAARGADANGYAREPFAADVSEGKNDPIYNAHSYHTKVPHKAIMRYILHYTDPGDIVFDGFCGTGMTGVAAQLCGDRKAVESLGYTVDKDGWIYERPPADGPHPPTPSPTRGEGEESVEYWEVGEDLRRRMVEVARQLRKTSTASEETLWDALRGKKVEGVKFRRQQPIGPFVVDFFAPSHRLVIEIDGPIHAGQQELDRERQSLLESLGLRFLRLPAHLVENDLPAALTQIRTALHTNPPSPLVGEGSGVRGQTPISRLGARKAVLADLSPVATFIAYNYNTPVDADAFEREARRILAEVEQECGWMYETWHPHCDHPQRVKARINYTVWSDIFVCPNCSSEINLWEEAVDPITHKISQTIVCPQCRGQLTKGDIEHAQEVIQDAISGQIRMRAKQVPVWLNYSVGGVRLNKKPDTEDIRLVGEIKNAPMRDWFPTRRIDEDIDLWYERDYRSLGIFSIDDFYTERNLRMTGLLWRKAREISETRIRNLTLCWIESVTMGFSKLNRYLKNAFSQVNRILSGTLYVGSFTSEISPWYALYGKTGRMAGMSSGSVAKHSVISTHSSTISSLPKDSVDYVFVDPPFGSNIIYSDLNIVWEAWLRLFTNSSDEAVVHRRKQSGHDLSDYLLMMARTFARIYEVLKAGRWMTVEFHNTQNAVWNAIQEAIMRAGFMVADVRTLDKQQSTFKQVTTTAAAKQDLVISAYKPTATFERRFEMQAGSEAGAWAFAEEHLRHLPVPQLRDNRLEVLAERQAYLLFDRMVAFHIQRGLTVPLDAAEFYAGLRQRYSERDGMYFLPLQAQEYDRLRLQAHEVEQLPLIVSDEKSAILWLRRRLDEQPQTYQDLQPQFLRELHQAGHEKLPELRDILDESFLQDVAGRWYVPDPARAGDLEKLRERSLLREFREYVEGRGRLKVFRGEAVRAGFRDAWRRRDYAVIAAVARRLPERVLQEDADLLMYYDNALLRMGVE